MALSLRQSTLQIYDDRGPELANNYVGQGWAYLDALGPESGFYNGSLTFTNESGDSFWFTFNGP